MASSSSSYQQNDAFSGIEPAGKRRKVSESSRLFEVFINHRGPDVKRTLAFQLYNSLQELGIKAFLDSEEKELGDSFPSTIETAIRSASVHIAIFSNSYAESAWCLTELILMLQTQAKIIPVFYDVKPSALRYIEKGVYAAAFTYYKENSRHLEKLEEWKEALQTVSLITGWEFSKSDVFDCKEIVSAVEKEVKRTKSLYVAKYPVGLDKLVQDFERRTIHDLAQDFERQCRLNEDAEQKARAVGIFGMGGIGKTTLSKELFNRMRLRYTRTCFLFDVREASAKGQLPSLQVQLIKDLFNEHPPPNFRSIEEGTCYIKECLERSSELSFLLIVDDIDHVNQLDVLLFEDILNKFSDSLLIVTTRDVRVFISTGINTGYKMRGMYRYDARELFCWHAFKQPRPASDYEGVVDKFIDVCGGLPLSLQVLGRHVRGRDLTYWSLELDKVRKILPRDIKESLKISFDALEHEEKQIFMDIACFFINVHEDMAITIWKGCGWNAQHVLRTLKDKCLIDDTKGWWNRDKLRLGMHDHLRDLGRAMAEEMSGPRRLWRPKELESLELKGFQTILAQTNVRCFQRILDRALNVSIKYFIGNSEDRSETSVSLLWLEIGFSLEGSQMTSIPSWIPLKNLRGLKIKSLYWWSQSDEQGPSSLKELSGTCDLTNLVQLKIHKCPQLEELPCLFHLSSLESVSICDCLKLNGLQLDGCNNLRKINLIDCETLKCMSGICDLTNLVQLKIHKCPQLEELPCLFHLSSLESVSICDCLKLNGLQLDGCNNLRKVNLFEVPKLAIFNIRHCPQLEELTDFEGQHSLERITIDGCGKLNELKLSHCLNLKTLSGNVNVEKLKIIYCPKLEELSSLSDVENLTIDGCKNATILNFIHRVQFEELAIEKCENAAIRNFIHRFQRVPSKSLIVIGRAVDGAKSIFSKVDYVSDCIGMKAHVIPIGIYAPWKWESPPVSQWAWAWTSACESALASACESAWASESLSAIIICGLASDGPRNELYQLITIVINGQELRDDYEGLGRHVARNERICHCDAMEKAYMVMVKKGEEWRTISVMKIITDQLFKE